MKKRKKTERQLACERLDKLVKQIVYIRDNNTCQHCLVQVEGTNRHGSHVIPVSAGNKLRWDFINLKVLCFHCHMNWWHKNPVEAGEWFQKTFPDRWEYLQANRGIQQYKLHNLLDLEAELKETLKGLK